MAITLALLTLVRGMENFAKYLHFDWGPASDQLSLPLQKSGGRGCKSLNLPIPNI